LFSCCIPALCAGVNLFSAVWSFDYKDYGWNKSYRISLNGHTQLRKWHDEIGFINSKQEKKYLELTQENNIFK